VLWNAGPTYYGRIGFSAARVHPVIKDRAQRYANLRQAWNLGPTPVLARAATVEANKQPTLPKPSVSPATPAPATVLPAASANTEQQLTARGASVQPTPPTAPGGRNAETTPAILAIGRMPAQ
jgi:hypothetical protein